MSTVETRQTKPAKKTEWKDKMAAVVTVLAVIGFAAFVFLIALLLSASKAAMAQVQWDQYVYLLTGVETITFTSIGWLFGKEVHREQAQMAERQAEEAMGQVTAAMKQNAEITQGAMEQVTGTRKETMEIVHQTMAILTQPSVQVTTHPSFIHTATSENTSFNFTDIDSPYTNDKPNAIVIVTPNWNPGGVGGTYDEYPIGVWYHNGRWSIYNQDKNPDPKQKKPMPIGAAFNVLVVDR
jgi:hypothetical protein